MGRRVLVTGGSGQLGRAVRAVLAARGDLSVVAPPRSDFPLDRPERLDRLLLQEAPDLVLHLGAFTSVDGAERTPHLAFRVNRDATAAIARWCGVRGRAMVYVSTDFVFDGAPPPGRAPAQWRRWGYEVEDPPRPLNVYGASKLAGEEAVRRETPGHWIVRTSWVFGPGGQNFPSAILRQAVEGRSIRVVTDQVGRPTYAPDLARALVRLAGLDPAGVSRPYGTYHMAGSGQASRYEWAAAVLKAAGWAAEVTGFASDGQSEGARRPGFSVLSLRKAAAAGLRLPSWRGAVRRWARTLAAEAPELLPPVEGGSA